MNPQPRFSCADVEVLVADFVDQSLPDQELASFQAHLQGCESCRALAADAAAAVAFIDRAAAVEPPPELVNKILFEITSGDSSRWVRPSLGRRIVSRWVGQWLGNLLEPRFAMGMAMTMLSFGMLLRVWGVREWADLNPVHLYHAVEDRVTRVWDRGVKQYQSWKLVFEIQARLQEWAAEQEAQQQQGSPQQGDEKR
jgi:hypothetical protein